MKDFLTAPEKSVLREGHRACRKKKWADRIKAILYLNEGMPYEEVATLLMLDDSTVREYKKRYDKLGIGGLIEDNYVAKQAAKLSEQQELELKEYLDKNLYANAKKVAEYVKTTYGIKYSVRGMTALLRRLGFVYKKTKQVPGKVDSEKQQAFIEEYEKIKAEKGEDDVIYFMDASHPQHNSLPAYGWILKGKTKELKTNTGRKRLNLHGALNLEDLEVVVREDKTINYESTIAMFNQLERKHPKGEIHLIIDNASYYKKKEVQIYAMYSRIVLHFLPAYSPNLNIIERLWRLMHEKILYNEYYVSYLEFKQACMGFFENIDQYRGEMSTRLTDSFEIIPSWTSNSHLR
jgi:transposase